MPWSLPVSAQALSAGLEADRQQVKGLAGSMVFEMPVRGLLLLTLLLTLPLTLLLILPLTLPWSCSADGGAVPLGL